MHKWGSDYKCVDTCRILRPPFTRNRKEKYGKDGLEVTIMRKDEKRFALEEVGEKIKWLIKGGNIQYFESVLEDIFFYEDEEVSEEDAIMSNFYPIDFEDDIFPDEPIEYIPKKVFIEELKRLEKLEREAKEKEEKNTPQIIIEEPLERPYYFEAPVGNVLKAYQGICVDYDLLPNIMWQNRDLIYYLSNRSTSEGCRNLMLYFLGFNFYYFDGKREFEELYDMCKWINDNYFKPPLREEELRYSLEYCFKKFEVNVRTKYIRNRTIQKYFPFTNEERQYTKGNYFPYGSKEYEEKEKRVHAKESLEWYYKKKRLKGEDTLRDKDERTRLFLREHPEATYTQAKKVLDIGENYYYRQRKIVQKELGLLKEKPDYESVFRENPNITYEEFKQKFDVTECTYYRKRKKYARKE